MSRKRRRNKPWASMYRRLDAQSKLAQHLPTDSPVTHVPRCDAWAAGPCTCRFYSPPGEGDKKILD